MKRALRAALLTRAGLSVPRFLVRDTVTILMLHRFAERDLGNGAHTSLDLRRLLETVRANRIPVVSLGDLPHRSPAAGAVAFTIDDGYADFASVGWPLFRAYDCPVTVFLATGFLDGRMWMWWDRVEWAIEQSSVRDARVSVGGKRIDGTIVDGAGRRRFATTVIENLKRVPDADREFSLASLQDDLGVAIPTACPEQYRPMRWDDVRTAAREGATFGPHTVTHPILSRVDDQRAESEILESWQRLRSETDAAIPVFCYPNGDESSFGAREEHMLERHRFAFAVTAIAGHASRASLTSASRYRIPRHACPRDPQRLRWLASGWPALPGLIR